MFRNRAALTVLLVASRLTVMVMKAVRRAFGFKSRLAGSASVTVTQGPRRVSFPLAGRPA